jgi:hypothetical protein
MGKRSSPCLDLHGIQHDESEFVIEKFITDNFKKLPIKIITGYSDYYISKTKLISAKYGLGCYREAPNNGGCYIIYASKWKKVLDIE